MKDIVINNIRNWFENESGNARGVILGISGGKDSTVVAKLLCEALGKDKVFGLLMPNGEQKDISDSIRVCELLGIKYHIVNIGETYKSIINNDKCIYFSDESKINIAPRIRMTYLYAYGQSINYRIIGTGNASERYIGYFTKWGDGGYDFNPIKDILCTDVIKLGDELGLPYELVHKTPSDGLCGKSDEDRLGFTYEQLDNFINCSGDSLPTNIVEKIEKMHARSLHKLK